MRRTKRLCQRAAKGAPLAMRPAVAPVSVSSASSGTARVTRPFVMASSAPSTRPSSRISKAVARPASATRACRPLNGRQWPIRLIGMPNLAPAPQIRRSQSNASYSPPPMQGPAIEATTG